VVRLYGKQYGGARQRECIVALRSRFVESASKTPRMHRNFTRENREAPLLSVVSRTRTAGRKR